MAAEKMPQIPDPTEAVIITAFCSALGLFTVTAIVRKLLAKPVESPPWFEPLPVAAGESRYVAPPLASSPYESPHAPHLGEWAPPVAVGKVKTSFYNAADLLGLSFIFGTFFMLVIASVRISGEVKLDPSALISSIGFQFISAGIVVGFVAWRVRLVEWLGLRWPKWPWVFLIAPCTVLAMWAFFAGLHFSGFMKWIESLGVQVEQDTVKLLQESNDPTVLALMAGAAVIAAPLCEEIVFRGYLYPAAKKFAGPWVAGICSALVFAAAHGSVAALLPLFVFGCVLVTLYEMTGSLWAPMAVHFCFNSATVIIQLAVRYLDLPIDPST